MRRKPRYARIRPHKKSVTGCWTCRRRRIKCDEQKPACQRCLRYGVECSGYAPNPPSDVGHRGDGPGADDGNTDTVVVVSDDRGIRQAHSPSTSSTTAEIRRIPHPRMTAEMNIETWSLNDDCSVSYQSHGFETTASPSPGADLLSAVSAQSRHVYQQPTPSSLPSHAIRSRVRDSPHARQDAVYTTPFSQPSPFTLPENDQSRPRDAHITAAATTNDCNTRARQRREHSHPAPRTHLDLLTVPSAQKRLIHHWVTFTSTKLVLIDEPTNPCRALMLPMALRGVTASSDTSTADIATFHAICACAAYNLYNLGGSDADHELALAHDQEAIRHLRHNLSQADQHHDQSFAMAIMACITIEAISGSARRWRTHVTGGLAYLSRLRDRQQELGNNRGSGSGGGNGSARRDDTESDVFATFQAHIVSMAILCGCDDIPGDLKGFLAGSPQRQGMELTFPYYGASSSFLRHQDRMNVLAAATGTKGGGGGGGMSLADDDDDVARELDALELQLYLDFPLAPSALGQQDKIQRPGGTVGGSGLPSPSPAHGLVLHHMAQAFYYASLVFCQRCVRRAALASVQGLVSSGVRQLEAVEAVSGGEAGSVMMWPALVLAAECGDAEDEEMEGPGGGAAAGRQGLQERMLAWFGAKKKFGFKNVEVLQELVQTLWAARRAATRGEDGDKDGGDLGWQEMIREERFDVFRL